MAKVFLFLGIFINLGILGVLKYSYFFVSNLNHLSFMIHRPLDISVPDLLAPIGISFYTMQIIGYLLDTYWGISKPEGNIFKTALFIGYYPQLISGPICRYSNMKEQLYSGYLFDWEKITFGLQRMIWGIFKKTVVSARLGVLVDTVYSDTAVYDGFYVWFAAAVFMFQLYTDFSGCMDIVLGASGCYGIILPENFQNPFSSKSVQEFWQRWHVTLGAWLKDYILYPVLRSGCWRKLTQKIKKYLGKKAAKQLPSYLGMLCVWLLIGLWHGGRWKYIIGMGFWFWLCIVLAQVLNPVFKKLIHIFKINTDCFSWHLFQSLRVFLLVSIGNMFFRIDGMMLAFQVMKNGLSHWNPWIFFDGSLYNIGLDVKEWHILSASLLIMGIARLIERNAGGSVRQWLAKQNIVFRWSCFYLLLFWIIIFGYYGNAYDASAFIYAEF